MQPQVPIPRSNCPKSTQSGPSEFWAQSADTRQGRQKFPSESQTFAFRLVQSASVTHWTQAPVLGSQMGVSTAPASPTQPAFEAQPHRWFGAQAGAAGGQSAADSHPHDEETHRLPTSCPAHCASALQPHVPEGRQMGFGFPSCPAQSSFALHSTQPVPAALQYSSSSTQSLHENGGGDGASSPASGLPASAGGGATASGAPASMRPPLDGLREPPQPRRRGASAKTTAMAPRVAGRTSPMPWPARDVTGIAS
jgi:hypothetical protein